MASHPLYFFTYSFLQLCFFSVWQQLSFARPRISLWCFAINIIVLRRLSTFLECSFFLSFSTSSQIAWNAEAMLSVASMISSYSMGKSLIRQVLHLRVLLTRIRNIFRITNFFSSVLDQICLLRKRPMLSWKNLIFYGDIIYLSRRSCSCH
ncbi:unknown protein [Desulfotalea psychrophila LSv54]|uniref:Uncharacterized protein n=1 Tax=Desulfotalea psychrophila (strain LSv54 / DSM 12343) TaxID=177439 RepID=Q6APK3_DESPS|nr:unknown protein [Desulfotalea psychrophila LSv54]